MPKLARTACVIAFIIAGLSVYSGLTGPIVLLPFVLIPLSAGIGILRKSVWSAYGFALYLLGQSLLVPFVLVRAGAPKNGPGELITSAVMSAILSALFFFAGRSLARAGSEGGAAWPWIAVIAFTTVPLLFVEPFVIPTGAMEDTLLIGDHILVQRVPKAVPQRGDLIVFVYPVDRHQTFVKRVIGVAGDRIRIADKIVYRDGVALNEPYVTHKNKYPDSFQDNFPNAANESKLLLAPAQEMLKNNVVNGEVVVPAGKYFVMGDNRDNSLDSRYWGFVSSGDLIGKPFLIYDSEDQPQDGRGGTRGAPRRIRWGRLFKLL